MRVRLEQRFHFLPERRIVRRTACRGEHPRRAAADRPRPRTVPEPARSAQRPASSGLSPKIWRRSQARAIRHSRCTVRGERSRTSATSSIVSPPKKRSSTIWLCCGIELDQVLQGIVERDDIEVARDGRRQRFVELHLVPLAAALLRAMPARMIDQDAAHQLRGDAEKVGAILPRHRSSDRPAADRLRGPARSPGGCDRVVRAADSCARAARSSS